MQIAIELPDELVQHLNDLLKDVPVINSLVGKDPLALQQEMRNEWDCLRSPAVTLDSNLAGKMR
jgi:hypothetical protein